MGDKSETEGEEKNQILYANAFSDAQVKLNCSTEAVVKVASISCDPAIPGLIYVLIPCETFCISRANIQIHISHIT